MDYLNYASVKDFTSSLDESMINQLFPFEFISCQCIYEKDIPTNIHDETAKPFSKNMAQLAAGRKSCNVNSISMYITKTSYYDHNTMKFLINKTLECDDVETIEQYYNIIEDNFMMHPPCASYMKLEYEQLLLIPYQKCFKEMTLWNYLLDCFNEIIDGGLLLGKNTAYDLAFKKCLTFCVKILKIDFEISKKNSSKPLIMKCLNYHSEKKTRLSEILKLLNKMFRFDFKLAIVNLVILIEKMRQDTNV